MTQHETDVHDADAVVDESSPNERVYNIPETEGEDIIDAIEIRTVVVFCDPRASDLLIKTTIREIVSLYEINEVITDIVSPAGVAIATEMRDLGITYRMLDIGHGAIISDKHKDLVGAADGVFVAEPLKIEEIDGKIIIIPAMLENTREPSDIFNPKREAAIDFGPDNSPGLIFAAAAQSGTPIMMIDTPERGLISIPKPKVNINEVHPKTYEEVTGQSIYTRRIIVCGNGPTTVKLKAD